MIFRMRIRPSLTEESLCNRISSLSSWLNLSDAAIIELSLLWAIVYTRLLTVASLLVLSGLTLRLLLIRCSLIKALRSLTCTSLVCALLSQLIGLSRVFLLLRWVWKKLRMIMAISLSECGVQAHCKVRLDLMQLWLIVLLVHASLITKLVSRSLIYLLLLQAIHKLLSILLKLLSLCIIEFNFITFRIAKWKIFWLLFCLIFSHLLDLINFFLSHFITIAVLDITL